MWGPNLIISILMKSYWNWPQSLGVSPHTLHSACPTGPATVGKNWVRLSKGHDQVQKIAQVGCHNSQEKYHSCRVGNIDPNSQFTFFQASLKVVSTAFFHSCGWAHHITGIQPCWLNARQPTPWDLMFLHKRPCSHASAGGQSPFHITLKDALLLVFWGACDVNPFRKIPESSFWWFWLQGWDMARQHFRVQGALKTMKSHLQSLQTNICNIYVSMDLIGLD